MIEIKSVEDFENLSKNNDVVVVKFGAEWCGPCRSMKPVMEKLSNEIENVTFAEANIEDTQELTEQLCVMSIPVTFVFKNGDMVERLVGLQTESELRDKIGRYI